MGSEASAASIRKDLTLIQEGGNQGSDKEEGTTLPNRIFPKVVAGGQLGRTGSRAGRFHILIIFFFQGIC